MKKNWIAILLVILGISCMVTKAVIGSYVNVEDVLVEPFFLIPLGYFFILTGITCFVVITVLNHKRNFKGKTKA